ncbi:MAG: O-methyltransferase [Acidimicrobiales bacterium]
MTPRSFLVDDQLAAYLNAHATQPDGTVAELVAETAALGPVSGMQIGTDQAALLTLLTGLVGTKSAVEVGTFTGLSSIAIARGLEPGGRLMCCDVSEEYTAIARRYWARLGLDDRIELRLAPAIETLAALPDEPTIDFAFIDADKGGYSAYFDALVPRMRPDGLIVVDNVLWGGRAPQRPSDDDKPDLSAIRAFNDKVTADDRVESVLLAMADGLTLARKR